MKYDAVFFDLDGTLLDTSLGVLQTTDYIIQSFQLPEITEDIKRSFIGPPIQKSFQKHYGLDSEYAWEIATAWRNAYKDIFLLEATPYDGVYELLKSLRAEGIKIGVATNKREDYTIKLLDHFSFLPFFDCIVGSDFEGKRNKTNIIQLCMKKTGVNDSERCLMVGDTIGDLNAAKECNMDFLGVTYGFGFSKESREIENLMASSCKEIERLVLK